MSQSISAGAATLTASAGLGGEVALTLDGVPLLLASLGAVVIDGARHSRLDDVAIRASTNGLVASGRIDDVTVTLSIRQVGPDACFEFALALANLGDRPVAITQADPLAARLVPASWEALAYASRWGNEYQPITFPVTEPRVIDVRSGRSSQGHSPFLALSAPSRTVAVAPVWSGNWHINLAPTDAGLGLGAGINPWKFSHLLQPGARFEAPEVLVAIGSDLEDATLALTRAVGAELPRSEASEAMPLEWNHWWPYEDKDITEAIFLDNAAIATDLGFAVSTLDAGWFGAADADTFWWDIRGDFAEENRARFPGGMAHLGDEVRQRGQKFGIWEEWEAVGLKAEIRRTRPDLMARRDDDPPEEPLDKEDPGFLGYICLGSAAGRAHLRGLIEDLIGKTGCEWIKLDFNLDPKAGCSAPGHDHGPGDGLYAHYRGLYQLLDEVRAAHPKVILEACSSGGLRNDAGLVRHLHCLFLSDPDWTPHHLQVVHGNSHLMPPAATLHWPMSEWRGKHTNQTLSLRDPELTADQFDAIVRSGFMHRFGLSWRLPDLSEAWRARLKAHLAHYAKEIAPLVRAGDLRRLSGTPLRAGGGEPVPAFQLSLGDSHLLLGFALEPAASGLCIRPAPDGFVLKPRALDPARRYRLRDLAPDGTTPLLGEKTGAEWMASGLPRVAESSFAGMLDAV